MTAREVTNDHLGAMSQDERIAWLDSMDDDESLVVHMPPGHWHSLVMAAYFKRALLGSRMPADVRLRLLEALDGMADGISVSHAVVAAVQPASGDLMKIIHEARALDPEPERDAAGNFTRAPDKASFDMLTSWECRWHIIKAQPDILLALRLAPSAAWHRHPAKKPVTN
jgi:hypothetical protein